MPKAFSEPEKDLIRLRLLAQGEKLFSAYGLKKTNVEEIAQASGISKGAFYIFYESKEALFMEVIEQVETRVRRDVLALIDQPGPTPRARLLAILQKSFSLFKSTPILKFFTGADVDLLLRRLPPGKFQQHLSADQGFFDALITRCRAAGIPILLPPSQIVGLLYPFVLILLHEDDLVMQNLGAGAGPLLELVAAYCLGEIELQK
jgi:AcrR family transcriptional regulator